MPSATGLGSQVPGTRYGSNPITSTRAVSSVAFTVADYDLRCTLLGWSISDITTMSAHIGTTVRPAAVADVMAERSRLCGRGGLIYL